LLTLWSADADVAANAVATLRRLLLLLVATIYQILILTFITKEHNLLLSPVATIPRRRLPVSGVAVATCR
jgi:hypothetical protein